MTAERFTAEFMAKAITAGLSTADFAAGEPLQGRLLGGFLGFG
jgi:hypothetical protein